MRKITQEARQAFYAGENFRKDNTEVIADGTHTRLYLHGHCIAKRGKGGLYVSHCGWETNTTKERLNGILAPHGHIYQKNYVWYFDDGKEVKDGWNKVK